MNALVAPSQEQLHQAWSQPETFCLLPERGPTDPPSLHPVPPALANDHFALLTSGSTGLPKLVVGERRRAEALARAIHAAQDLDPVESTVCLLPLSYSYAFVNQWVWSRIHQRQFHLSAGLRYSEALLQDLSDYRNSMICLVGAQVPLLLDVLGERQLPHVLRINFAGGRFPAARLSALAERFPNARFFNNYGCAEAMPRLTIREEPSPASPADPAWLGQPLPGIELRSDDDGALQFRSPYSAVGWVDATGWHPIGTDDWVHTGDLGQTDAERGGWRLEGRRGEVFKRYGEKIALPSLLRLAEARWPAGCAIYRDRDGQGEEAWVLVLAGEPDKAQVRDLLGAYRALPRTHWPLRVEALASLPLLPNGKPDSDTLARHPQRFPLWTQSL